MPSTAVGVIEKYARDAQRVWGWRRNPSPTRFQKSAWETERLSSTVSFSVKWQRTASNWASPAWVSKIRVRDSAQARADFSQSLKKGESSHTGRALSRCRLSPGHRSRRHLQRASDFQTHDLPSPLKKQGGSSRENRRNGPACYVSCGCGVGPLERPVDASGFARPVLGGGKCDWGSSWHRQSRSPPISSPNGWSA